MEKDFTKEVSKPGDTPDENVKDEEWAIIEQQMLLEAQQRSMQEYLSELIEKRDQNARMLASLERSTLHDDQSQFRASPFDCNVSPVGSPFQGSQFSSEYTTKNSSHSTNLTGGSMQTDISSSETLKALAKHSENISVSLKSLHEEVDNLKKLLPKQTDNETQTSRSLDSQSRFEIIDDNEGPRIYYFGKGKEASNPKFRYKKGSRNVSSCDSPGKEADKPTNESKENSGKNVLSWSFLTKDTPRIQFGEVSSTSESKPPQESKVQVKNILGMKRKSLQRQHLDESGPSTSGVSQNLSDDDEDLKIAKRMKFDDGEKPSDSCPTLAALLANKKHESLALEQFMDFEKRNEPSTSASLIVGGESPKSEGSYRSDIAEFGDRDASPIRSERSMSPDEKDLFPSEGEESSRPIVNEDEDAVQKCGNYLLELIQYEYKSNKDNDEDSKVAKTDEEASPSNTK